MGIRAKKLITLPALEIPEKSNPLQTDKEEEPTLNLPNQPMDVDEDDDLEELNSPLSSTVHSSTEEPPSKKRKRIHLCDKCHEAEATQIKKLRKHSWTDKNRESFAKCQETKRLKQAFEKARQSYGKILADLDFDENSVTSEEKQVAKDLFTTSKNDYESYAKQLEETRTKKKADEVDIVTTKLEQE